MRERSSRSPIIFSSLRPLRNIDSKVERCAEESSPISPWRINSSGASTIASGVLNSWVMLAKSCDLKLSSAFSCSWAASREALVSSSRTWFSTCSRSER